MKKATSEKQKAANRRNARRSTGPRTAAGKAVSRLNAVKHGLLAQQVVACGFLHQESPEEFKKLCQEYYESLRPVGPIEEMFVSQIITVVWRLRRVRTAETGEIAVSVEDTWGNPRRTPWEMGNGYKANALYKDFRDYLKTVEGIEFIIECLQALRELVVKAGRFTWEMLDEHKPYMSSPNEIIEKLTTFHEWFKSNPQNLPVHKLQARHLKDVLNYLDKQIKHFGEVAGECQIEMDSEDAIRRAAAMLPPQEVIDKIVRYECALQRQLYRSLNQLERIQRRRLGENVPPPAVMDISLRS